MTAALYQWARIACVTLFLVQVALAQDQTCYYPNGAKAPEKPCSSAEGSACCPDKWECLDNGSCYYPPDKLHGRYSCTDKSWEAEGCPSNLCTYDMTAAGGESLAQCSDHNNQWCCNGDANIVDCCKGKPNPRPFFDLADGQQYAIIGSSVASSVPNLATITGLAAGSGGSSPSSTKDSSSSTDSATKEETLSSTTATPTPVTSVSTSVSSGSGGVSTIVSTFVSTVTPNSAASTSSNSAPAAGTQEKKSKVPIIVGCAVGIPVALAFVGILFWLFRKRAHQKKNPPYSETSDPYTNGNDSPEFAGGAKFKHANGHDSTYKHAGDPGVPELPSQSVGPDRPVSNIPGKAELGGGPGFAPGTTPVAPHLLGVGGGTGNTPQTNSSWNSAPPGYSPGQNQNTWGVGNQQNPPVTSMPDAQTYVPYRPPQGHPAAVPEMAELPVNTPPAVMEMGHGRTPPALAEMGTASPVAELRTDQSPPAMPETSSHRFPHA
ncbi:hypothetical protein K458DRAFT_396284 [Lentithecium fluviatile CBS 122367]|uniref:Mid2 domain-containing protein n=1 Tax=Lentithecium fluviatile CBS 122367 TaxID=1168545 RepID=A0A6G1IGD8_9PLEO|nr:hypothetical protein K458DRAFT_396284 [Lentithecium fluviatile CBS 122367]